MVTTTQLVATLVGGAAAGAMLTGLVTLITTTLSRHHEHRQWLLDRRLEAYAKATSAFNTWFVTLARERRVTDEQFDMYRQLVEALARVQLLAPRRTLNKTSQLMGAVRHIASDPSREQPFALPEKSAELNFIAVLFDEFYDLARQDLRGDKDR